MSLILRWRAPARAIAMRWRGPAGMIEPLTRDPLSPVAAIIGPPGPAGPSSAPVQINASLASTWILANPLGRLPTVHVYLASGEPVITDVTASASQITVAFASPQQGYVLAF